MSPTRNGSIRLFHVFGIEIFVHWSWLVVAMYVITERKDQYSSLGWNAAEYASLFAIVLLHELGHSLACRSVGGRTADIVLWPLGGVAYVAPPPRPGAVLWSIAAGPLVNVVLILPLTALSWAAAAQGWSETRPDAMALLGTVTFINLALLIFNMLPVYPLDGGQILRALLWFVIGRSRSLFIVVVLGFAGVAGLAWLAFSQRSVWLGVIAAFVFMQCMNGWAQARALMLAERDARPPDLS